MLAVITTDNQSLLLARAMTAVVLQESAVQSDDECNTLFW